MPCDAPGPVPGAWIQSLSNAGERRTGKIRDNIAVQACRIVEVALKMRGAQKSTLDVEDVGDSCVRHWRVRECR